MGRHSAPAVAPLVTPSPVPTGPRHARPSGDRQSLTAYRRSDAPVISGPLARPAPHRPGRHRDTLSQASLIHPPLAVELQSGAQQARTGQPRTGQTRTGQPRTGQARSGSHRAGQHRAPAASTALVDRAPLWRRSPAVPAALAVLAVWGGTAVAHALTDPHAAPSASAADVEAGLGDLVGSALGSDSPSGSPFASAAAPSSAVGPGYRGSSDATTASAAARLAADGRVSRQSRAVGLTGAVAGPASKVPTAAVKPVTAAPAKAKPARARWVRPSAGAESSCFCMRWGVMHDGIDLAGPAGSPIVAVGDGVVTEAGPADGYGMWVAIRHANGDYSIYGHMYRYYVRVGQHVRAGQHIADIGNNGRSTGPHLHFGIARGSATGPFVDPVPWLKARGVNVGRYNPNA